MIELYTHNTPNGHKISICLEELELPYTVKHINVYEGEQFKEEFVALNPNAKVPVIVDQETGQTVFESCAILLYLADKTGRLVSQSTQGRWEAIQWLFFQAASIGPMFGQRAHFALFAPEKIPYAIERYTKETERLYGVLEQRLKQQKYLCGDEYSIVDIAHWGWVYTAKRMGFGFDQFSCLIAWHDQIAERPAVQKGIQVPGPLPF
ncbi:MULTISPECIES: glutathione S-transferase family protein [Okeania]|uniref:Glutathione S-transferase family protein n=1 Tax=Okeania hirsuta TaxID=1458930 RepID=A0A3N6PIK8_9CYAN|nr:MULTISPECIES: glutathione binding-like protein [Okeania]NET13501.1 glutathione S-transferase family protein [Okeania sp. SIO1H6]NES76370.1 glutathione S-transferase family protein [Okeania sp. SIO1H4]NES89644.1 glutathione S-transferase family protein [Okeania sp. SIO2B9]NET19817.1 glutathione S-transferase family protein [Okeania sp. SIO1H5]NET77717.1 glutathione S-transferase family protein [Okeania sp. SIO1F9]